MRLVLLLTAYLLLTSCATIGTSKRVIHIGDAFVCKQADFYVTHVVVEISWDVVDGQAYVKTAYVATDHSHGILQIPVDLNYGINNCIKINSNSNNEQIGDLK